MRKLVSTLGLFAMLAAPGCTLENRAQVYPPISGAIDVRIRVDVPNARVVEFALDGQQIGQDNDPTDGFTVELDSPKFSNGLHTLRLTAKDSGGTTLKVIEHTILIQN